MAAALEATTRDLDQQMGMAADDSQFLTFLLGEEEYGVEILRGAEVQGH